MADYVRNPRDPATTDEIVGEIYDVLRWVEDAQWAAIDRKFWHEVVHGVSDD